MITYTDARGLLRREPHSEFLAVLPGAGPTGWSPRTQRDVLHLTDGQRHPGSPRPAPEGDDPPVLWDGTLASISIPLDAVSSLTRAGDPPPSPSAAGQDAIAMLNGDRIGGFVISIGPEVRIEHAGRIAALPLELVRWIRLANPARAPQHPMLWLGDGTAAQVTLLPQTSADSIDVRLITPGLREPSLSDEPEPARAVLLAEIRALAFAPDRLVGLGSLPLVAADSDRPWTPEPILSDARDEPLGAPDITLPAPMSAAWALPPSAVRIALEASLPQRARLWGDAELTITIEQDGIRTTLAHARLHADAPDASFNLPLPPPEDPRRDRRIIIALLEGPSGPAQDVAVLHRPLILLASP